MGSIAAIEVAREVIETVRKGKIPVIGRIAVKKGYSIESAKSSKPQRTKSYKAFIEPFTEKVIKHRERILERMAETVDEAEYHELSSSFERTTKVIQLLTGGSTENLAVAGVEITIRK